MLFLILSLSDVSSRLYSDYTFMAGRLHKRRVLLGTSQLETHDVYLPFIGDAHFDHLIKGVA